MSIIDITTFTKKSNSERPTVSGRESNTNEPKKSSFRVTHITNPRNGRKVQVLMPNVQSLCKQIEQEYRRDVAKDAQEMGIGVIIVMGIIMFSLFSLIANAQTTKAETATGQIASGVTERK